MRIDLVGDERRHRGRGTGQRRRSRTFHSAVALPRARSRRSAVKKRASTDQGKGTRTQGALSRQKRRHQAVQPVVVPRDRFWSSTLWRSAALRLPVLLVVVALVGTSVYVSVDTKFYVYQSEIVGRRHLDAETIYQAAGVHEENIFWIAPAKVAERVVQLEGVKAARVRCELPALVTIEVEEREPVVMWRAETQRQDLWLDAEGVVLPYHGDVTSPDTVFVVDASERHLAVGDWLEPKGIVQSVLQLDAALPGVRVFYYQSDRGLSFAQTTDGGEWPVYVGTSQDLQRKIQVLQVMNDYLRTNGIRPRYVDVRWPDHPVYGRPSGRTTGGGQ